MKNVILNFMLFATALVFLGRGQGYSAEPAVRRFDENPIIRPEMLPGHDGGNINGPSLIRVPDWIKDPLGRYYLYFAHHGGKYIRLAYANDLAGPWKIYEPGTLKLDEAPGAKGHIASPDVIVDHDRQQIRMYFHGPAKASSGQKTFLALSKDGLTFEASDEILGIFYWRVFEWNRFWYGMAKGGKLYRSRDGLTNFEEGPNPFPGSDARDEAYNNAGPRHVAVHRAGDILWVYYTSIGDAPERIFRVSMKLAGDWNDWRVTEPVEVLRPEMDYEGASLPLQKSRAGAAKQPENALRDPAIFEDTDGKLYLLYSVAGESGIAIAQISAPASRDISE